METPKVVTLHKGVESPSFSIKLSADVLEQLTVFSRKNLKPKLVVKGGQISIKLSDDVIFTCSQVPEYQNLEIYQSTLDPGVFAISGKIKTKLNVVADAPQVRDLGKTPTKIQVSTSVSSENHAGVLTQSMPASPLNFDPYLVSPGDSKSDVVSKFLFLLAMGPTSREQLTSVLQYKPKELDELLLEYCQVYDGNDAFLADDIYPNRRAITGLPDTKLYILKDKAYKNLRPWDWKYYSTEERLLIIANSHNALKRLGYSETHPLRKKILEKPTVSEDVAGSKKPPSSLGGGILVSSKKTSPFKKSQTDSPRLGPSNGLGSTPTLMIPASNSTNSSPLRHVKESKKRQLSQNSSSSSDEEAKRIKKDKDDVTSPSSVNDDDDELDELDKSKSNHYTMLATKFRTKYKDYETLYNSLHEGSISDPKKALSKLFELHQALKDWKKQLWNYDNELKSKTTIMNLSKHKKTADSSENHSDPSITFKHKNPKTVKRVLNY
ncbi:hypothetical protein PSN45_002079 [Yamadazyma tenuis]|uniref:Uncharacterized protein n=1 Tax=Candida tenuis (strain ATCC 10573 / BCRC 21748 / CBS 615 / JCM 9827 / NBRC 10315 / NRRL Y-1498 / VKM Y-70) TaxID=590646 RepID=G3BCJ0_CANTC|nr:uncharacterized protein CANTEDRAFT_95634 [Yamadazyma tenuis ATCC 10573]EGV60174.1 hypothetical protein CANTEDRAFT_95634 [Yamadazyma tenuis ATCC 10573]WEJ94588.1 hypothetical protein PSN45_002079 [Yamadazyma tenuis]